MNMSSIVTRKVHVDQGMDQEIATTLAARPRANASSAAMQLTAAPQVKSAMAENATAILLVIPPIPNQPKQCKVVPINEGPLNTESKEKICSAVAELLDISISMTNESTLVIASVHFYPKEQISKPEQFVEILNEGIAFMWSVARNIDRV